MTSSVTRSARSTEATAGRGPAGGATLERERAPGPAPLGVRGTEHLSHPAIIAREHGIPAVVATISGTRSLRTGELVTVDGNTGRVERA